MEAHGVQLDEAPIETPGAMKTAERYHTPLRLAYKRIRAKARAGTTDQQFLDLAVSTYVFSCLFGSTRPFL